MLIKISVLYQNTWWCHLCHNCLQKIWFYQDNHPSRNIKMSIMNPLISVYIYGKLCMAFIVISQFYSCQKVKSVISISVNSEIIVWIYYCYFKKMDNNIGLIIAILEKYGYIYICMRYQNVGFYSN